MVNDYEIFEKTMKDVKNNGMALRYAFGNFKNNKNIVLEAVKENGEALQYASVELRNDEEIVMEAIKNNELAIVFASERLKSNSAFVLEAVKKNNWCPNFISKDFGFISFKYITGLSFISKNSKVINEFKKNFSY